MTTDSSTRKLIRAKSMVEYRKTLRADESDRAPTGMCEVSIHAFSTNAFNEAERLQELLRSHIDPTLEVQAYEYEDRQMEDRVVTYSGTDRLDIETLRDVAEVYNQVRGREDGNIPPEMVIIPVTRMEDPETTYAWLEFQLQEEVAEDWVRQKVEQHVPSMEITAKNPIGERGEAILFRGGNVSHSQVRDVVNQSMRAVDQLPVEYSRIICESVE